MPELPEAERARRTLESVLGRTVAAVDDTDTYVCRPHQPGEIASALTGHAFVSAHRRGKFLWLATEDGPTLGLHLGMAGSIALEAPEDKPIWDRFTVEFEDGTRFALRDRRRLGRALLDPDFSHVGPDAAEADLATIAERLARGGAALKAALLDQGRVAGIGNLLADEVLWQARLSPRRPAGELDAEEVGRLHEALQAAIRSAVERGGAHTGDFIASRVRGAVCPRCGAPLHRATVGGRTTFWCPAEQL